MKMSPSQLVVLSLMMMASIGAQQLKVKWKPCKLTDPEYVTHGFYRNSSNAVVEISYTEFESFAEIHLTCDIQKLERNYSLTLNLNNVIMLPRRAIALTHTLRLDALTELNTHVSQISIQHMTGFGLEAGQAFVINQYIKTFIQISVSDLIFYYRDRPIDADLCHSKEILSLNISLFAGLGSGYLSFFEADNFKQPICPLVFKNADIQNLLLANMKYTTLTRNRMSFIPTDDSMLTDLNSNIHTVVFNSIYKIRIDSKLIDRHVFRNTTYIGIFGTFDSIETEVFKDLASLSHLRLDISNTKEFLHSSDNKWMSALFYSTAPTQEQASGGIKQVIEFAMIDVTGSYGYPDEDFCLFKYYPVERYFISNFGRVQGTDQILILHLTNSCTYAYLIQNNDKVYEYLGRPNTYYVLATTDQETINQCDLSEKISWCQNHTVKVSLKFDFNTYDFNYALEWLEFIGPIVTFPVVAITGFTLNLLVILIIVSHRNKQEKFFEQKLYKYILMNSVFNCVECFISVFGLMSECIGRESIYCSSIEASVVTQYFRIYVVGYLGEIMKTCSILNGLAFSLERYVVTAQPKNKYLVKFGHARVRHVCAVILVTGSLTSIEKIFEFHVDRVNVADYDLPNPMHINSYFGFSTSHFFYFFHYVLNDFALLLFNIIVDIKLARIIREDLKLKEEVQSRLEHIPSSHVYQLSKDHKTNKTVDMASERKLAEQKTNSMIISSLIVYLICRLPELASAFFTYFYYSYKSSTRSDCTLLPLCSLFFDAIEYIYMISYILNIIFYYRFNKNFRHGFRHFFKSLKSLKHNIIIHSHV